MHAGLFSQGQPASEHLETSRITTTAPHEQSTGHRGRPPGCLHRSTLHKPPHPQPEASLTNSKHTRTASLFEEKADFRCHCGALLPKDEKASSGQGSLRALRRRGRLQHSCPASHGQKRDAAGRRERASRPSVQQLVGAPCPSAPSKGPPGRISRTVPSPAITELGPLRM